MLVSRTQLDPFYVAVVYALLPVHDWTGNFRPILPVGWTLIVRNVFTSWYRSLLVLRVPILRIARRRSRCSRWVRSSIPASPTPWCWSSIWGRPRNELRRGAFDLRMPRQSLQADVVVMLLLAVGFAAIALMPVGSGVLRPITWGVPAACIVASAVALERRYRLCHPGMALAAGDALYAIYLTHGFVVPLVFVFAARVGLSGEASLGTPWPAACCSVSWPDT